MNQEALEKLIAELRPQLHRYCARMTGSVIDGEDVLHDALVKAFEALPRAGEIANPSGWLFRIAHNAALDTLRRSARREVTVALEDLEMAGDPEESELERQAVVATSLQTFMRLPVIQRSTVILKDVLGYSVAEVGTIVDVTVPAVKSALQRGRERLRELAREPEERRTPALPEPERRRLAEYIERFNASDFDAIRAMLADDVRLDLVNRVQYQGRAKVSEYFHRYAEGPRWQFTSGFVEGRPAILALDPNDLAGPPRYFILIEWRDGKVAGIRDFFFARYALEGAELGATRL